MLRQYQITQLIIEKYSNEKHFFKFSYCVLHLFDFSTFILHVSKDAAEGGENFWHILNTFAAEGGEIFVISHTIFPPPGRNFFLNTAKYFEVSWKILRCCTFMYSTPSKQSLVEITTPPKAAKKKMVF